MEALRNLANNVIKLDADKILHSVLSDVKVQKFAINLNTNKQLINEGVGVDSILLSPEYATITKHLKTALGRSGSGSIIEHVTLYDTGEFHAGWAFDLMSDGFVLEAPARSGIRAKLRGKYGEFEGLTDNSLNVFIDYIRPLFIQKVSDEILQLNR